MKTIALSLSLLAVLCVAVGATSGTSHLSQHRVAVSLVDGSIIHGRLSVGSIPIKTDMGTVALPSGTIGKIIIDQADRHAIAVLHDKTLLHGTLDVKSVELEALFGPIRIGADMIRELQFTRSPDLGKEPPERDELRIDGSTKVGPIARAFIEALERRDPDLRMALTESGSGNGMKALIEGQCQIALMSRLPTGREIHAALDRNVYPVPHAISLDDVAIIVHPGNPVNGLSLEQVRDIFAGRITNWKKVGGEDQDIVPISRDTNSGTYETFEATVMAGADTPEQTHYINSCGSVRFAVSSQPSGIGYIGMGFLDDAVKPLTVDGIACTAENVRSARYPLSRQVFMVTDGHPRFGGKVHRFVSFWATRTGHEIIRAIGFTPITEY